MQKITPFLWFNDNAEDAVRLYSSIFKNSKIGHISRYGEGSMGPAGSVMTISFELAGQEFMALNGGPHYQINEAISFVVNCESQEEVDYYWDRLTADGGQEVQCGWLKDKFGLSWQITPTVIGELMQDSDPGRRNRAMQAMLKMVKLDIAELRRAADGK